ncbi:MAG: AAA family ATPase [Candidatus Obscuribacterales bacterium]|nr:AAA family ATPase [Candidatus Obscuribacterales bacterium]
MDSNSLKSSAAALRAAIEQACSGLVERQSLVETIALSMVAREHALVIGPPGTAKSEAVRRIARATGGRYFEYLIGRFTEPSEIFGPVDLSKLKQGVVETQTAGMLPEAEIAFLDEIFLGSTAILNTLLSILQERVFRRGHTVLSCPLRICVGAANSLPETDTLGAFSDRFLVHFFTESIPDSRLEDLLEGGWNAQTLTIDSLISIEDLDRLADYASHCDMNTISTKLAHCLRKLRSAGLVLSDRRIVKLQKLIAAAAVLGGREQPCQADLWALILAIPSREEQAVARESLSDLLMQSENESLTHAVEELSLGPLARAKRIVETARLLLAKSDGDEDRLLALEGIAREIDAGFAPDNMPIELKEVRELIIARLDSQAIMMDGRN